MAFYTCNTERFACDYSDTSAKPGVIFGNHCHPTCECMLILEGDVSLAVENRIYRHLQKGNLVLIAPLSYHSSFSECSCRYRRISVRFTENALPDEIRAELLLKMKESPVLLPPETFSTAKGIQQLLEQKNNPKFYPLLESYLTQLLYLSLENTLPSVGEEKNERLARALAYIDAHMAEKISLKEIAAHSFLSLSTLCHLFQSQMKISVKQYVLQKKMSYAAGLLQGGMPAVKAAEAVGYTNYADFYAVYKKNTGHSPKEEKNFLP